MGRLLLMLTGCLVALPCWAATLPYAVADKPLPVYNRAADAASGATVRPDACGQVRQLEFIALPGTTFRIVNSGNIGQQTFFEVTSNAYHPTAGVRLFVNPDGLTRRAAPAPPRMPPTLPPKELLRRLRSAVGMPYVWGGNVRQGVTLARGQRAYAGLDCSGLLYEATDGLTPRNTAELVGHGQAVPIAGLSRDQLISRLKPLDLIVWKGHVVVVLDRGQAIESVLWCGRPGNGGVRISKLRHRLGEIMALRRGVDRWPAGDGEPRLFVVRRWLP